MRVVTRRTALGLLGGGALLPLVPSALSARSVADGSPLFLTAATRRGGRHGAAVLDADGELVGEFALPGRGHGAAVRPVKGEAVIFARRPGTFALVLDPATASRHRLIAARDNRHFYGHGCFSRDGGVLFATENDFEGERGIIGLYDAQDGYRRIGEFPSHGIGPHEMALMPDGKTLVVANGGILTHPDAPRMKLNLSEMTPSITLLDAASGELLAEFKPPPELHQLSLRHLDVRADGRIVAVAQWEGSRLEQPPLIALLERDAGLRLIAAPSKITPGMRNYCGSVAFSGNGQRFAVSSPRGGLITIWDGDGRYLEALEIEDGCGLAPRDDGFLLTSGQGVVTSGTPSVRRTHAAVAFDNHLMAIS